jgi:hypothetical protein
VGEEGVRQRLCRSGTRQCVGGEAVIERTGERPADEIGRGNVTGEKTREEEFRCT